LRCDTGLPRRVNVCQIPVFGQEFERPNHLGFTLLSDVVEYLTG
jgi:hypothetical protein